ncbi:DUF7310 family coiled-coil domain-containing protein [Haloplanus aerogenes]|uniref:DUF7310 domain-containing protein n=1 Tax=Haloplanus aerogenes TaxID=660522 RepID=A0A3M0D011_9EURY|nr:hypothetical protein [Haloplanus aerogenes]AZH24963.1 hypothetical protein DU502_06080 [Haloplanus aerogenes]RMB13820.1 hypothetical protein ATH50_2262 [Haloplanus aerogenes]
MDDGRLEERVDALERAVTDGHAADGLPDAARMDARVADLEATVEDLDDRLAELDAAVQALRGFAGGVRAVDESVERRANAAIARVERLESELQETTGTAANDGPGESGRRTAAGRRDGRAERHRTAPDLPEDEQTETRVDQTDGGTVTDSGTDSHLDSADPDTPATNRDTAEYGTADADTRSGRNGTLRGTVTDRSDAALAEVAANETRSSDESSEDRSLADRLRRLL